MNWITTWTFIVLLIVIHSADMLLTEYNIGDDWTNETFLPMKMCIQGVGIHNACWVSRVGMYIFIFLVLFYQNPFWRSLLVTVTILYWTSMLGWIFNLNYVDSKFLTPKSGNPPICYPE